MLNPIKRYRLSNCDNLKKDANGSIALYLQTDSPGKDKESNWLPAPKGLFYLICRTYAPETSVYEGLKDRQTLE